MMEFCDPEQFEIILAVSSEDYQVFRLKELIPMGFGPANLAEQEKREVQHAEV